MTRRPFPRAAITAALALGLSAAAVLPIPIATAEPQAPAPAAEAADVLKRLQSEAVATRKAKVARAYHFGSQGTPGPFSNHGSHSNRLIPFYTFGRKIDPASVTGANSVYRSPERLRALYGYLPEKTVNPEAEYCDQSDFKRVMADAVAKGVKHLFIVWFDGLDYDATRAAAIAKTGQVYREGKGAGLIFQDFDAEGSARFGYYVTASTGDRNEPDVDAQTVVIPADAIKGGYDVRFGGPNPWTPGPLTARAPGYLKGQSGDARDKAGVIEAGGVIHSYTDSAPSAAEFISGRKSYNDSINALPDGTFVRTLFHDLQDAGWKVGTATSVPFPHASPSAMYARNVSRDDYQDLSRDMLGLPSIVVQTGKGPRLPGLDVVLGTGFGQVASTSGLAKAQGKNAVPGNLFLADADLAAIDAARGGPYVVVTTREGGDGPAELAAAAAKAAAGGKKLFGFYGTGKINHLPYRTADGRFEPSPDLSGKAEAYTPSELASQPTLADMTRAALAVLSSKKGAPFALFVEAGDVDFALHANNLDNAVGAVYSGEDAIRAVIDWVEANSNWDDSAMVVAADHGHYLVIDDDAAIAGAAKPRP